MKEYIEEIQVSRELMMAIHKEMESGYTFPRSVQDLYRKLMDIYQKEIEDEIQ